MSKTYKQAILTPIAPRIILCPQKRENHLARRDAHKHHRKARKLGFPKWEAVWSWARLQHDTAVETAQFLQAKVLVANKPFFNREHSAHTKYRRVAPIYKEAGLPSLSHRQYKRMKRQAKQAQLSLGV